MPRQYVENGSIVRTIWGDADIVLLIFAGCAAEFALNRAVDWLFFTGRLPNDPVGRLFTTARYAQEIVFADETTAQNALERIRTIHAAVERQRGQRIPEWAHRDVLYMLVDYSEKAYRLLHRPLATAEQEELYDVFHRVGAGLGIPELPSSYDAWRVDRERHLKRDLVNSDGTKKLYERYRDQLGAWRFDLLLQVQALLVPDHVRGLLKLDAAEWLRPIAKAYPLLARAGLRSIIQQVLLPSRYLSEVRGLDHRPRRRRTRLRLSLAP